MLATHFSLFHDNAFFKTKNKKVWNKMSNRFKRNQKLKAGRNLPPSFHKLPGKEYDIRKSEAVKWFIQQPEILDYVWDQFKQSGDIFYDPETGVWTGVDWEGEDDE